MADTIAKDKIRFNFAINKDLKEYVDTQAELMGFSLGAFVSLCIATYKEQKEGLKAMQDVSSMITVLTDLQKTIVQTQIEEKNKKTIV